MSEYDTRHVFFPLPCPTSLRKKKKKRAGKNFLLDMHRVALREGAESHLGVTRCGVNDKGER